MRKQIRLLLMLALPMLLGLASCAEHDNPVDPNPLAKQVSGLWWNIIDQEGTHKDATDSYPYTRLGQAICFNEDGTGYGITFFFDDDNSDPIAIIGGKDMCPFTYTSKADGRLSLDFSDAYYEYADYFKKWTMSYADGTVSATNGKLTLTLEKASDQMAETIRDWDEQFNGGAAIGGTGFNPNDADFTRTNWRNEEGIYLYDGTGEYALTHGGRTSKFSLVPLPWYNGPKDTNLPDHFCDDITPENGWELVLNLCGNTQGSLKNNNFFAVYNKYSGILRFFYFLPDGYSTGNDHVWEISMSDHLAKGAVWNYGLPADRTINKAAIGQNRNGYSDYVTPWVKNMSADGLVVPNHGWWAFDVDMSQLPDNGINPDDIISLQMRSWTKTHTTLASTVAANIDGSLKAQIDLTKTTTASSSKGLMSNISTIMDIGNDGVGAVTGAVKGDYLDAIKSTITFGKSLYNIYGAKEKKGSTTEQVASGTLTGTINLGLSGTINTQGTIEGANPTVGIASPTIYMKDFDLANSHLGQGVWGIKTAPVVYWATETPIAWDKWVIRDDSALRRWLSFNFCPYFFDPSSVEIELNPNIFPDSQIEWIEVDAICGARAEKQPISDELNALRSAYGVGGPTTKKYRYNNNTSGFMSDFGQNDCLWDFCYNSSDKYGLNALNTIYTSEDRHSNEQIWVVTDVEQDYYWKDYIQGRGIDGYAIEPQVKGSFVHWRHEDYDVRPDWSDYYEAYLPFLEVNVTVRVKMKGMDYPVVLSRNYLPEIKDYGDGSEFNKSRKKTRPYASKMSGHTDLYDYQMKRIDDILERYEVTGNWDGYNYIPLAGSPVTWKDCGHENLFNGETWDRWEPLPEGKVNGVWFAEFKSRRPITPSRYYMTTCIDGSSFPSYHPKSWKVYAKVAKGDSWTTIATVTNDNRLSGNRQRFEYPLSVTGRQWQYFRLEFSENHGGAMMQFAEFEFDQK